MFDQVAGRPTLPGRISLADTGRQVPSRSVLALIGQTIVLYGRCWWQFLIVSGSGVVIIFAPLLVAWTAFGLDLARNEYILTALLAGVAYYVVALLETITNEAYLRSRISLRTVYRKAFVGVMTSAVTTLVLLMLVGPPLLVPVLGLLAAAYLTVRLTFAFDVALLEHAGPVESVRAAWRITRGQFWRSSAVLALTHGYLLGVGATLALFPHPLLAVAMVIVGLPPFSIFRVLAYRDLLHRDETSGGRWEPAPGSSPSPYAVA